ncbi:sigma 54-interacting transcriptional regulator [Maledivibacter halophilus]|uniref:Transcriptional regulator containing PAS, AAA-type ATPase, and DNA-binding Fis domains n=1 Tax=Maledivibacter halophilus TaxID=36842 RepID=A0A1T5J4I5_9FIRM|nr:sigma 54-interacting transcriptional regulator [Maledivibacter halophilus]SKC46108.1 Transcriptional regulator containing PAS, AAA-type ATPase, and DNA-binding Fis domains [Maledivibacter halophilus]
MKKIIIAAIAREPLFEYKSQLKDFFGDSIYIEDYSLEQPDKKIDGDLVIVLTPTLKAIAYNVLKNGKTPVICIQTVPTKKQVEIINNIPDNSKVLIISAFRFYAKEIIEVLNRLSKESLNFIPYYLDIRDKTIENIDLSVYVGDESLRPSFAKNYINIGWKKIHPQSFKEIINILFPKNSNFIRKLNTYEKSVANIEFSELVAIKLKNESRIEVSGIIDCMKEGVIILDEMDRIVDYNNLISKYFNIEKYVYENYSIYEIPYLKDIADSLKSINNNIEIDYYFKDINKAFKISKEILRFQSIGFRKIIRVNYNEFNKRRPENNKPKYKFEDIHYKSKEMGECVDIAKKISKIDSPILIVGETGTGKELLSHAIHNHSHRKKNLFFAVNCTAFQDSLLESELFGYEPGSFTGALSTGKKGIFEIANGGTVFLDEIGDAPMNIQSKLLRVLQEKEIRRIGGNESIPINVRIVSATNKNLKEYMDRGMFRKDLYYRLNTYILNIPPLRERREDIRLLIMYYLNNLGYKYKVIDNNLVRYMMNLPWEGNIRELKNCVDYLGYMSGSRITIDDLPKQYKNDNGNNINSDLKVNNDKRVFYGLSEKEEHICKFIVRALRKENMGRRKIYDLALEKGIQTTEHKIRKMMKLLEDDGYVLIKRGRKGCILTDKGIRLYERIIL